MRLLAACAIGICAYSASDVTVRMSCKDLEKNVRLLKMAKERSQELYLIEDPERYQEDREFIDQQIKKLNEVSDRDCKKE